MKLDQVSPAAAEKRSSWRALRPWLLLGGFVALWWVLSTGAAQADSTPRLPAHVTERANGLTHARPLPGHVKRASHLTRSTAQATVKSIHAVVGRHLPSVVAKPVATLVDTAGRTVRSAVPAGVQLPQSSIAQGNSAHHASGSQAAMGSPAAVSATSSPSLSETLETFPFELGARTLAALDHPFRAPFDVPVQAPVSAAFVPLASILLIGLLDALSLGTRSALQDSRPWRLARLPGGATFEPGSSPD